jgi:hypothetical protein
VEPTSFRKKEPAQTATPPKTTKQSKTTQPAPPAQAIEIMTPQQMAQSIAKGSGVYKRKMSSGMADATVSEQPDRKRLSTEQKSSALSNGVGPATSNGSAAQVTVDPRLKKVASAATSAVVPPTPSSAPEVATKREYRRPGTTAQTEQQQLSASTDLPGTEVNEPIPPHAVTTSVPAPAPPRIPSKRPAAPSIFVPKKKR